MVARQVTQYFSIGTMVKTGDNTITLKASPMKIHAEIEPVYILGDFSVKPADKGFTIEAPAAGYTLEAGKIRACHSIHGESATARNTMLKRQTGNGRLVWAAGEEQSLK